MIDYKKCLEFCIEQKLKFPELMLLYTLHIRNEEVDKTLYKSMNTYYQDNKDEKFLTMVRDLEKRGFLEILRDDGTFIEISNLKIEQKFVDLLFIDPDEIWNKFYQRYPTKGYMDGKEFTANMLNPGDKELFKRKIIKNVDRFEAGKILYYVADMFDFNPKTGKPEKSAKVGISKFLLNWDEILRQWKEQEEDDNFNYGR